MTELTITPKVSDKTARFKGTVAAGEHVAVTIKGGAEWLGEDDGANLTLRVLDLVTGRTLAVFPRPAETLEEGETPDAWSAATEDANDLYCELNLNTMRMVAAARHMLRVPVLFVLGDTDDPRTLYFRDRYEIEYWPERIGDTAPYDLDKWPKQIDEWSEQVAQFGEALAGHVGNAVAHVTATERATWNSKYAKPVNGIPANDLAESVRSAIAAVPNKADKATTYTKTEVDALVSGAASGVFVVADSLPATGEANKIYLVPNGSGAPGNVCDEYMWVNGAWELIGSTQIDLTNYYNKTAADGRFVQKEAGKGLVAVDSALSPTSENPVQNKVVSKALYTGFTEWEFGDGLEHSLSIEEDYGGWRYSLDDFIYSIEAFASETDALAALSLAFVGDETITATRHIVTPTKTSQLTNDSGFLTQHQDISGKLDGAAAYPAWVEGDAYTTDNIVSHKGRIWKSLVTNFDEPGTDPLKWVEVHIGDLKQDALSQLQLAAVNSGATAAKVATWDGYAEQIAAKASLADLSYAMVTPGEWKFSGSGIQSDVVYSVVFMGTRAYLASSSSVSPIDDVSVPNDSVLSVDFTSAHITATRASLPGHLLDRANNLIDASTGNVTLTLPAYQEGKVRDLLVHVNLGDDGTDPYTVTVNFPSGETSTGFKVKGNASAPIPAPDAAGEWLFSFSESSPHKMAVALAQLQDATVSGGS